MNENGIDEGGQYLRRSTALRGVESEDDVDDHSTVDHVRIVRLQFVGLAQDGQASCVYTVLRTVRSTS